MAATKSSFSPEQVSILAVGYDGTLPEQARRDFIAKTAKAMGKTARQVIGKISTMKASHNLDYVPYEAKAKVARKATNQELVNTLAENTGIKVDILNSLTRSSKAALEALVAYTDSATTDSYPEADEPSAELAGDEVAID